MTRADVDIMLQRLGPDLDRLAAPWTLIGSAALILHGVPNIAAADLDIVTSPAGAGRLRVAWGDWLSPGPAKAPDGPFRSEDFARYETPWGAAEVMGGLHVRQAGGFRPLLIGEVGRLAGWPVPSAAELLRILNLFGRPKDLARAAALEAWLATG